jgi:rod shape-determining protein MreC
LTTAARRIRDGVLSALLLAFPVLVFHANVKSHSSLNVLDKVVLKISSPLEAAAEWTVSGIGNAWKHYLFLVDVQEENDRLRKANRELRVALIEKSGLASENDRLRRLLELRRTTPAETIAARVVGAKLTPYFRVTRVQLDNSSGALRPNLPVIAPEGVVGLISKVYTGPMGKTYADVKLAVDPRSTIAVKIGLARTPGFLHGQQLESAYTCSVDKVDRSADVKQGDTVVTSGVGGYYPADLPIGKVSNVSKLDYAPYQEVEVEPFVDFGKLEEVLIILAPPPPPDPDSADKAKQVGPPARGPTPAR